MDKLKQFLYNHPNFFIIIEYVDGFKVTLRRRFDGGSVIQDFHHNESLDEAIVQLIENYERPFQNP